MRMQQVEAGVAVDSTTIQEIDTQIVKYQKRLIELRAVKDTDLFG
jgi:hypothetical protein